MGDKTAIAELIDDKESLDFIFEKQPSLSWDELRERIQELALLRGDVAGYPMPIEGARLVVAENFPYQGLNGVCTGDEPATEHFHYDLPELIASLACAVEVYGMDLPEILRKVAEMPTGLAAMKFLSESMAEYEEVVNSWYSHSRGGAVTIYRNKQTGKHSFSAHHCEEPVYERFHFQMTTALVGSEAWAFTAEQQAMEKLKSLLSNAQYESYFMSGMFIETSKRSNICYLFRRCRPTVALRHHAASDARAPLVALCMHPLGHYDQTFAGVMCPSDDVIAHVLLMRADERKYWAKCNQHPLWQVNSGV